MSKSVKAFTMPVNAFAVQDILADGKTRQNNFCHSRLDPVTPATRRGENPAFSAYYKSIDSESSLPVGRQVQDDKQTEIIHTILKCISVQ